MAEAKTKQRNSRRVAQWQKEVLELQGRALELVMADRNGPDEKTPTEVAVEVAQLAEDAFYLLWSGWSPELVFASATASLKAGKPVLAVKPVQCIPGMAWGLIDQPEAPKKLQRDASEVRVIREADPLPEPEHEEEPEPVEDLEDEAQVEEIEEIEEEPTPEPEPEPQLPVVITEQQWEADPEPEPEPEPEPPAEPEPEPPAGDGWVTAQQLAVELGCSWASITKGKSEGLFDGHFRDPLPGEGRGVMFDVEPCRAARANREDRRLRKSPPPVKPVRVSLSADRLRSDPELLDQLEQMLAAVRAEG